MTTADLALVALIAAALAAVLAAAHRILGLYFQQRLLEQRECRIREESLARIERDRMRERAEALEAGEPADQFGLGEISDVLGEVRDEVKEGAEGIARAIREQTAARDLLAEQREMRFKNWTSHSGFGGFS